MFSAVSEALQTIMRTLDLFEVEHSLLMKRKLRYSSFLSGLVSLMIIITFSVVFFMQFLSVARRTEIFGSAILEKNPSPTALNLSELNQTIAFYLNQDYVGPTFVKLKITQQIRKYIVSNRKYLKNGTTISQESVVEVEPCSSSRLITDLLTQEQIDSIQKDSNVFQKQGTESWLCPKANQDLVIQGVYGIDEFQYLKIELQLCLGQDCASLKEAEEQLSINDQQISLQIFFINYIFRPEDVTPFMPYIETIHYYKFNPTSQMLLLDLYFREQEITTYENSFLWFQSSKNTMIYSEFEETKVQQLLISNSNTLPKDGTTLGKVYLRRSPYSSTCIRRYKTIADALSYVGGLIQIIMAICTFFLTMYNRRSLIDTIAENCYQFAGKNDLLALYRAKEMTTIQTLYEQQDQFVLNSQVIRTKTQKCFQSISRLCHSIRLCCQQRRHHQKVINVGKELVYGDLDITRIVNLMHDVERIKCLLFNNEQLDIFNYLPKPRIHIESLVEERGKPEIEQITIEPPIFQTMFESSTQWLLLNDAHRHKHFGHRDIILQQHINQYRQINSQRLKKPDAIENKFLHNLLILVDQNTQHDLKKRPIVSIKSNQWTNNDERKDTMFMPVDYGEIVDIKLKEQ